MHTYNVNAYLTLKKILREYKPDIVQLHTIGFASPSDLFCTARIPDCRTIHGPEGLYEELAAIVPAQN